MKDLRSKIILSLALIIFVNAFGTIGYMIIEGWNFRDSLYMTVITLTTVGYGEVHSLSPTGVYFTIVLLIGGVGIILYILASAARVIFEGELQEIFGRRRLEKKISELRDHYIICGYGKMGEIIVKELEAKGIDLLVIEKNPQPHYDNNETIILEGDATSDEVLKEAGIDGAKGLVSVLSTDAENLYVVLTARELNPDLLIIARTSEESADKKILRAGANRVVSPYRTGSTRITNILLKPAVVDFIEYVTKVGNVELQLEEVPVIKDSKFVDTTLDESGIGRDLGVIIVAIKKSDGTMMFNPTSRSTLQAGDKLIAMGEVSKLKILEDMVTKS